MRSLRMFQLAVFFCSFFFLKAGNLEELKEKAEGGDIAAMNYIGYLLLSGDEDTERDPAAGLAWLIKAASLGDAKAASNLGWLYTEGDLVGRDEAEGARWLKIAAGKGLPVAQSLLGDLYRDGRGVERDTVTADSLYRQALRHGLRDAGYRLYALHADEYPGMLPEDQLEEGRFYFSHGVPSEGVKLFYMAADKGSAEATAMLGEAYARGEGVPYDYDLSLKYYAEAAVAGNPSAQFVIGELLEIFPDSLKNTEVAGDMPDDPGYWYEKAAAAGVTDAETATRLLFPSEIRGNLAP